MATSLTKFKGGAELQAYLNQLPAKMEQNVMRSALRQGANVIRKEAQATVPVDSGDLRKSIKVRTRSRRGQVTATVETKDFKAHWIEFGTEPHEITPKQPEGALAFGNTVVKSVQHPGTQAQPFMRPAADSKVNEAIVAVGEQIRKRLATKHGINVPAGLEVDDE